jgi:WD40 repeat protein
MSADEVGGSAKTKVFISYSRKDLAAAEALLSELGQRGYEAYLDKHDILPGEPWRERISKLIEYADTVIFVISPSSIASEICGWEVAEAERLSKRILPVVHQRVDDKIVPAGLSRLNYLFLDNPEERAAVLQELATALETDIEWIREHTRLGEMARRWDTQKRSSSEMLRGAALEPAERWLAAQPKSAPPPTRLHREFILASRRAATRRQRWWLGGSIAAAIIATALSVLAYWQRGVAVAERDRADGELQRAQIAQSRSLADSSRRASDRSDRSTAALLALEGLPDAQASKTRPYVEEAERALYNALLVDRELLVISNPTRIEQAHFSLDGTRIIGLTKDKRIVTWSAEHGDQISSVALAVPTSSGAIVFSPDLSALGIVSGNEVAIRSALTGEVIASPKGHEKKVTQLGFSPDGKRLLSAAEDGTARVWNAETGAQVALLGPHPGAVTQAAFSPDGHKVCTAAAGDKTARVWNAQGGELLRSFEGHEGAITHCTISTDGITLLTSSEDKTVRAWNIDTGEPITTIDGFDDKVDRVMLSKSQQLFIAVTSAGAIGTIDLERRARKVINAPDKENYFCPDTKLALSNDTNRLLVACMFYSLYQSGSVARAAQIAIFDPRSGARLISFVGHQDVLADTFPIFIESVAFAPGDERIMTLADDNTIRVWQADRSQLEGELAKGGFSMKMDASGHEAKTLRPDDLDNIRKRFPTTDSLVAFAKATLPRCLTPAQRNAYFLDPEPPRWCIGSGAVGSAATRGKWPYQTEEWRAWLARVAKGENPELPTSRK